MNRLSFLFLAALALPSCAHRPGSGTDGQDLVLYAGILHGLGMGSQVTRDLTLETDPPLCLTAAALATAAPVAAGVLLDLATDKDVDAYPQALFPGELCIAEGPGPWDATVVQQAALDLVNNGLVMIDIRVSQIPMPCEDAAAVHHALVYIRQIPALVVGISNGVPNYVLSEEPIDRSACG